METSGKLFQIEVLGIYEARADSHDEAYARLERALDRDEPIVLKHASTASLKRGKDGKPYAFMLAAVGTVVDQRITRLEKAGYGDVELEAKLEEDDYEEAVG